MRRQGRGWRCQQGWQPGWTCQPVGGSVTGGNGCLLAAGDSGSCSHPAHILTQLVLASAARCSPFQPAAYRDYFWCRCSGGGRLSSSRGSTSASRGSGGCCCCRQFAGSQYGCSAAPCLTYQIRQQQRVFAANLKGGAVGCRGRVKSCAEPRLGVGWGG